MLSAKFRLKKYDIERLYKKGKFLHRDFILIRFLVNRCDHPRFAVIVPKKVSNLATVRNRIKRKTHDFLQKHPITDNLDIAINFKQKPEEEQIFPVLEKIFQSAKIK